MNLEIFEKVREWGREKELKNPDKQIWKTLEELGELAYEVSRNNTHSPKVEDAFGDILVTLIIEADIYGYKLEDCLLTAYQEIKNRKGKTIDDTFIKEQ